ncbi:MAG: Nudix family hydrolase [Pseudomonadota bacterium]
MPNTEPDILTDSLTDSSFNASAKPLNDSDYLKVVIAIICRGDNVLISKRAADVHLAGLWEFPGGKIEASETAIQALHRELNEELGISISAAEALISIPCHYPEVNVLLDVWIVTKFTGWAFGKEDQQIKWSSKNQLAQINFPEINKNIINALLLPKTYLITENIDLSIEANKQQFIEQFRTTCRQGFQLIQLRFKTAQIDQEFIQQLLAIGSAYQVNLQLNSCHFDALKDSKMEQLTLGLHLSSHELQAFNSSTLTRLRLQYRSYISASCHTLDDVLNANQLKLDFIVISPVNKTTSHLQAEAIGWEAFAKITTAAQMPVYALGGMSLLDIEQAKQHGGQGIAGISCFWNNQKD